MIGDLISEVAGIVEAILSGVEARGPRVEFRGPSLYEFIDDVVESIRIRSCSGSTITRSDFAMRSSCPRRSMSHPSI